MRKVQIQILGVILATGLAGCGDSEVEAASELPPLPRVASASPDDVLLSALMSGPMTLENGCLRVRDHLIIWHPESRLEQAEDGRVRVVDGRTGQSAYVGDDVAVGGGEITMEGFELTKSSLAEPFPDCEGPYWLGSGFVHR